MKGGSVADIIHKQRKQLSWEKRIKWVSCDRMLWPRDLSILCTKMNLEMSPWLYELTFARGSGGGGGGHFTIGSYGDVQSKNFCHDPIE